MIRNPFKNETVGEIGYKIIWIGALAALIFVIVGPYLYAVSVMVRPSEYLFEADNVIWIPPEFTLEHIRAAWSQVKGTIINSALIGTGTAVLSLIITIPAAYIFGRKEFPGKTIAFYLVILALMFPYILLIVPIADIWTVTGLYNTLPGLWISYQVFVTPFAVWILKDFFSDLPKNLEEAAQVYGLTEFKAFVRVILPLAMPAIVAVGFLSFLTGWNDFLFSNMLTTGTGPRPATVVIYNKVVGTERPFWNLIITMSLLVGTPPLVLYMVARHYLAEAFSVA
jgi:ABC-type glycerol-3-phosphate transport system permease component